MRQAYATQALAAASMACKLHILPKKWTLCSEKHTKVRILCHIMRQNKVPTGFLALLTGTRPTVFDCKVDPKALAHRIGGITLWGLIWCLAEAGVASLCCTVETLKKTLANLELRRQGLFLRVVQGFFPGKNTANPGHFL